MTEKSARHHLSARPGCFVPVDRNAMERFISVTPDFANWTGQACAFVDPEEFGTVVATRDDQGDVCIVRQDLWRERMFANLGNPMDQRLMNEVL